MRLGEKVRMLRQNHGWNQATLAKESGITQATISRIESGKITQPKMGQLNKLAHALGTTIDDLAGDNVQRSLDDLLKDKEAQMVFRGWGKLSPNGRKQLAQFVKFLEQQQEREEQ